MNSVKPDSNGHSGIECPETPAECPYLISAFLGEKLSKTRRDSDATCPANHSGVSFTIRLFLSVSFPLPLPTITNRTSFQTCTKTMVTRKVSTDISGHGSWLKSPHVSSNSPILPIRNTRTANPPHQKRKNLIWDDFPTVRMHSCSQTFRGSTAPFSSLWTPRFRLPSRIPLPKRAPFRFVTRVLYFVNRNSCRCRNDGLNNRYALGRGCRPKGCHCDFREFCLPAVSFCFHQNVLTISRDI